MSLQDYRAARNLSIDREVGTILRFDHRRGRVIHVKEANNYPPESFDYPLGALGTGAEAAESDG